MNKNLNEITNLIEQWSMERDLHTANSNKQYDKLIEEFGELMKGINKNDIDLIKDSIGDMYVVLVVMGTQLSIYIPQSFDVVQFETQNFIGHNTLSHQEDITTLGFQLGDRDLESEEIELSMANIVSNLQNTCADYQLSFIDCVNLAYNEIKGRKGKTINETFIKESDL